MTKGVSKELRQEIHSVLEELINDGPGAFVSLSAGTKSITFDAVNFLADSGVLVRGNSEYRLTAIGREYWDRINTPTPVYWFCQNWFPAIVAAATIAASISGAVANFL